MTEMEMVQFILDSGDPQIIDCLQKSLIAYVYILDTNKLNLNAKRIEELEKKVSRMEIERGIHQSDLPEIARVNLYVVPK